MAIEIRELVIRATITDPTDGQDEDLHGTGVNPSRVDFERLVSECVSQVLNRLREKNER